MRDDRPHGNMSKRQLSRYLPHIFICLIIAAAALNVLCLARLVGRDWVSTGLIAVMAGNIFILITGMKNPLTKRLRNYKAFIWLYISSGLAWLGTYAAVLFTR